MSDISLRPCGPADFHPPGFSLVELLSVIGIISLVLAVAAVSMSGAPGVPGGDRQQVRALVQDLRFAREDAMLRGEPTAVTLDLEARHWTRSTFEAPSALPGHWTVTMESAQGTDGESAAPRFVFHPDGSSTGGRITIATGNRNWQIDIDWLTGRIRSSTPDGAAS